MKTSTTVLGLRFVGRKFYLTRVIAILLVAVIFGTSSEAQQEHKNPARGIQSGASYSISDIETINTTNGNLILNIPLASLPKGRGEIGQSISLRYNSKLYDTTVEETLNLSGQMADQNFLSYSEDGGWKYAINTYNLDVTSRFESLPGYQCNPPEVDNGKFSWVWKVEMRMPDGSRLEFRPTNFSDQYNDGFFRITPNGYQTNGCSFPSSTLITSSGMVYYSTDGSYTRLVVNHVPGELNTGESNPWTMSMPDGSRVTGGGGNAPRLYDRNGNYLDGTADIFGRSIGVQYNAGPNEDYVIMQGVGNAELKWIVKWKNITVEKEYLTTGANSGRVRGGTSYQTAQMEFRVVDRITLPSQLGSLYYEFDYNSEPGGANGWGEISKIKMPSDATADYEFKTPLLYARTDLVLQNYPSKKTVTQLAEYDGSSTPVTEITNYTIGKTGSTITAPDGSTTTESHGDSSYQNLTSGLVYRTVSSNGNRAERIWAFNRPTGANTTANINAYVKTEFTTIADASGNPWLTTIKDVTIDPNGNQTDILEYDWVAYSAVPKDGNGMPTGIPGSAVLKRKTISTFNNSATGNASYAYWSASAPNVRNAVASTEVQNASGAPFSRTEIVYDNFSTTANVVETKIWDSFKGGVARAYSNPLTTTNSISTFVTYNQYGMPLTTTDAKGVVNSITYGNITTPTGMIWDLYPTQIETASNYASLKRTSTAAYDFFTGLTTTATDVDNNVSVVSEYDALGRPLKVRGAAGTALESWTRTEYNDLARRVIVRSDLETIGDGKKVAVQHYDQLGRVRLSRSIENIATEDPYNETHGIKVETRYQTGNPNSYQLTSNPFRAATATTATNEQSMGWTRSLSVNTGRHAETESFSGASLPAPWGTNTNSSGKVLTDIDANSTMVTDQAGKQRRSITNALGQLTRVDEPDANNNLGTVSSPTQATYYAYDTLGKMVKAQQGVQNRYFLHDSLGRLLRVRQPEQIVNTALNTTQSVEGNTQWTAGFSYDNNNNLLTAIDAKNVTIANVYDALNRTQTRSYSDSTPTVNYTYDDPNVLNSKGKLTKISSAISETRYKSFDKNGRLVNSEQATDGQTYPSSYKYNLSGILTEQTYPSGRVVQNMVNSNGDLSSISSKVVNGPFKNYASNFKYTASGVIEHLQIGNGLWESAKLNNHDQVTELNLGTSPTDGSLWKLKYDYGELDANGNVDATKNTGNIAKQTVSLTGLANPFVQTYKYDSLYRISEAKETNNATQTWIQNFGYDRYGNRTSFSQNVGGQQLQINNLTLPNIDQNTNRYQAGQGYQYDAVGNLVSDAQGRQFVFDGDNKQVEVKDASNNVVGQYLYDGNGKRVKKITGSETVIFVYDGMGKLAAEYSTAPPVSNPTVNYTATDPLGSPRVITNKQGQIVSRRDFMPFGEELAPDTSYRTANLKYGTGDNVRQKFTGYLRDEETGLDFAEARYYNNNHGRFTAVDPLLASGKSSNPQTFNRYAYTMNRPLILTDSTGLQAGKAPDESRIAKWNIRTTGENTIPGGSAELSKKESGTLGFKDNTQGGFLNLNVDVTFKEGTNPSDYSSERTALVGANMPNADIGKQRQEGKRDGSKENPQNSQTVIEGQTKTIQDNPGASTAVTSETGARIPQTKTALKDGTYTAIFVQGERNKKTKQLDGSVLYFGVQIKFDKKGNIDPTKSGVQVLTRDQVVQLTGAKKPEELLKK